MYLIKINTYFSTLFEKLVVSVLFSHNLLNILFIKIRNFVYNHVKVKYKINTNTVFYASSNKFYAYLKCLLIANVYSAYLKFRVAQISPINVYFTYFMNVKLRLKNTAVIPTNQQSPTPESLHKGEANATPAPHRNCFPWHYMLGKYLCVYYLERGR